MGMAEMARGSCFRAHSSRGAAGHGSAGRTVHGWVRARSGPLQCFLESAEDRGQPSSRVDGHGAAEVLQVVNGLSDLVPGGQARVSQRVPDRLRRLSDPEQQLTTQQPRSAVKLTHPILMWRTCGSAASMSPGRWSGRAVPQLLSSLQMQVLSACTCGRRAPRLSRMWPTN
jgi:hypothetical protein